MTAYVITWAEPYESSRVLGVRLAADAALEAADEYRRRRRVQWIGPWIWREPFKDRHPRAWPRLNAGRLIVRSAESPHGWPGGTRECVFCIEAFKIEGYA